MLPSANVSPSTSDGAPASCRHSTIASSRRSRKGYKRPEAGSVWSGSLTGASATSTRRSRNGRHGYSSNAHLAGAEQALDQVTIAQLVVRDALPSYPGAWRTRVRSNMVFPLGEGVEVLYRGLFHAPSFWCPDRLAGISPARARRIESFDRNRRLVQSSSTSGGEQLQSTLIKRAPIGRWASALY